MRLLALVSLALLLPLTACTGSDGADRKAACAEIQATIDALGRTTVPETAGTGSQTFAQTYAEAAKQFRATAANTTDQPLKSAANSVADALDALTDAVSLGRPPGPQITTRVATTADALQKLCTPSQN
ncbi:hypothetical protein [Actinocorallia longicatena]|uniref:Lipoprotein n=1 Tax=Actinocorallia longicatena TaxID=111803 RepID=A0ABP6QBQ1_9ACTN